MKLLSTYCVLLILPAAGAVAGDWPQWQGPDRDAVAHESGLLQQWPEGGPPLAWRIEGLGGGDSAPAVVDGKLYGMSNRDGQEIVWALSAADGSEIWAKSLGDAVEQRMPQSKEGPGCTPSVDGDRLYVIGMGGRVACLKLADGEIVWQRSLTEDFGGSPPAWSYRESPLIDGEKLICTPGAADAMMVALDKTTGETIWKSPAPADPEPQAGENAESEEASRREDRGADDSASDDSANNDEGERRGRRGRGRGGRGGFGGFGGRNRSGAAYSSAIAVDCHGERQYVQFTAKSVIGVAAADGALRWRYDHPANPMGINCSTPLEKDGLVFAASAYGTGGGAIKLVKGDDGTITPEEVYFSPQMQNHHGGMIVLDGYLYGANGGNSGGFMACLDFRTGDVKWRDRKAPKGSIALADGRLYLRGEDGELVLMEPSPEEFIERGRFDQPDRRDPPAWAHPVVADGKLYIRDQDLLLCYDVTAE